jgi:hypothetical protein
MEGAKVNPTINLFLKLAALLLGTQKLIPASAR